MCTGRTREKSLFRLDGKTVSLCAENWAIYLMKSYDVCGANKNVAVHAWDSQGLLSFCLQIRFCFAKNTRQME
jgi:hypothetical protein